MISSPPERGNGTELRGHPLPRIHGLANHYAASHSAPSHICFWCPICTCDRPLADGGSALPIAMPLLSASPRHRSLQGPHPPPPLTCLYPRGVAIFPNTQISFSRDICNDEHRLPRKNPKAVALAQLKRRHGRRKNGADERSHGRRKNGAGSGRSRLHPKRPAGA